MAVLFNSQSHFLDESTDVETRGTVVPIDEEVSGVINLRAANREGRSQDDG